MRRVIFAALFATTAFATAAFVWGQSLPSEPTHVAGESVAAAFEGWFRDPDGTINLLFGYYNRNRNQDVDVPVGPNNRVEPGGPDRGQPTHFVSGRGWGIFAVKVPANFGDQKVTWTLTANGKTTLVPGSLNVDYELSPLVEAAVGNSPPEMAFAEAGPWTQGPHGGLTGSATAKVGTSNTISVWVADDAKFTVGNGVRPTIMPPPVNVRWTKYRGPGEVKFATERMPANAVERKGSKAVFNGKADASVTFSEPGEYVLNVQANDYSGVGGAGFQCCWSNAQVKVNVTR